MPLAKIKSAMRRIPGSGQYRGIRDYLYDFRRFSQHSSALDPDVSPEARAARVTKTYHMIEKGLALPEPRPGFGQDAIAMLLREVPRLEAEGHAGLETDGARATMAAYVAHHDAIGHAVDPAVRAFAQGAGNKPGGAMAVTRAELQAAAAIDFAQFARARHSVRNFTGEPVSEAQISAAIAVALKSPRVCNRESRRVHVALSPEARQRMLGVQNGNRGFGHLAGAVLMITSDVRDFVGFNERNQCFVDGGLFAMTLAYALHAQGLGTCMLNASNARWRDRQVRAALPVPDHEVVITFMAVGHLPEKLSVAQSPAPSVDQVMRVLG